MGTEFIPVRNYNSKLLPPKKKKEEEKKKDNESEDEDVSPVNTNE